MSRSREQRALLVTAGTGVRSGGEAARVRRIGAAVSQAIASVIDHWLATTVMAATTHDAGELTAALVRARAAFAGAPTIELAVRARHDAQARDRRDRHEDAEPKPR